MKHITEACKYCGHQPTKLEAAAPALLAALETLVERLDAGLAVGETEEMIPAREAIALATGKEG